MFAAAVTLGTGLLFGAVPALRVANTNPNDVLKSVGRSSVSGSRMQLRNGLVVAELALATVLLIGAGLLIQTLVGLQRVRLGFDPHDVLTFQLAPPAARYPAGASTVLYRRVLDGLREIPGVGGVGISSGIPFGNGAYTSTPMTAIGAMALPDGTAAPINWRIVSPDYFATMGMTLVRGRLFADSDGPTAQPVTIAYSVSQRTGEIGLRMACGAQRRDVIGLVVGEGMRIGSVGVAVGLALALVFSRVLATLVFGVTVRDPLTFGLVTVAVVGVARAACVIPARRAACVDPMIALRLE